MAASVTNPVGWLIGAALITTLANAYFFKRFHARTRDPIFAILSWAFVLMAIERLVLLITHDWSQEHRAPIFTLRLVSFVLIIVGMLAKGRRVES
jgi:hypothetical protein